MQISGTRHASRVSTELTAGVASFCTGSAVLAAAISTGGVAGRRIGRGSGKAAPPLPISATETPSSPIAVACGASTGSARAVTDVARLSSIGAPVFSMPGEPRRASPAATQPARTTVPHNPADTANRRGLITPLPPVSSKAPPEPGCTGQAPDGSDFSDQIWSRKEEKPAGYHFSRNVLPEYNSGRDHGGGGERPSDGKKIKRLIASGPYGCAARSAWSRVRRSRTRSRVASTCARQFRS